MVSDALSIVITADPESDLAKTLRGILEGQGHSVQLYPDRAAARDAARQKIADLVVTVHDGTDTAEVERLATYLGQELSEPVPLLIVSPRPERVEFALSGHPYAAVVPTPLTRENVLSEIRHVRQIALLNREVEHLRAEAFGCRQRDAAIALIPGVAHEISNMMFAVLGHAELALAGNADHLETLRESARVSAQLARQTATTAANLLLFCRQAAGSPTLGDLNDAIQGAVRLLRRPMEKEGIRLILNLQPLPKTMLFSNLITQAFISLLMRAWDAFSGAVPGPRQVEITTACRDNKRIAITVRDTGRGVPDQALDVLPPGSQPLRASVGGTLEHREVLWLATAREIIHRHGGLMRVDSSPTRGASCLILLPVVETESGVTERPTGALPVYSILIIDDEESSRRVAARMLTANGHHVFTAANVAEAMPYVWGHKLDLIIMDVVMHPMDGVTAIRHLRDMDVNIPILLCTGRADAAVVEEGLRAGASFAIHKPFSTQELIEQVYRCIETICPKSDSCSPGASPGME